MKPLSFFFKFTKGQRKGIVALLLLIILFQAGYLVINSLDFQTEKEKSKEEQEWLAMQSQIDALKAKGEKQAYKIYPFNPNYISDYKGYTLGMTTAQIDRLHKFRATGRFVNSVADFKDVTKVPDSLLNTLSPYFKFPDWVIKQQQQKATATGNNYDDKPFTKKEFTKKENKIVQLDINDALEEDLEKVHGIGPAFAKKILRRRADFGAFVSMDQMADFKEFSPEAVAGLRKYFKVGDQPKVNSININTASLKQLTYFPYFNRDIAKAILTRRSMKGKISKIEELLEINDFPVEKVKIIALYLEF